MLSQIPLAANVPLVILVTSFAAMAVIVIVIELIAAWRRSEAHKKGAPGVALNVREDASAKVPTPAADKARELTAGAETKVDMQGGAQSNGETAKLDIDALSASLDTSKHAAAVAKPTFTEEDAKVSPEELLAAAMGITTPAEAPAASESRPPATERVGESAKAEAIAAEAAVTKPAEPAVTPAPAAPVESAAAAVPDDGKHYDLVLTKIGADQAAKIDAIRVVRQLSKSPLFQAMQMVDTLPATVMAFKSRSEVEVGKQKLEAIGATVELREAAAKPETPAAAAPAPVAEPAGGEPTDEDLETMAEAARKGRKKRKTFKEYEEDRKRQLAERERLKAERQANYRDRLQREVLFVGRGVSAGLAHSTYDSEKLKRFDLPRLGRAEEVALAMGITPAKLRWLCYHREDATCEHYSRFTIPKRSGGEREISSPKPDMRKAQSWVLENILQKIAIHDAAHGFVPGRSTVSNATPHVRPAVLIKLDVKDFFPSITYHRVKGLFYKSLGFGESAATVLALICTEPPRVTADYEETRYRVAVGQRQLPQGACTSPALTNIICRKLDARLSGLARKYGFTYTRYADDITISGPTGDSKVVGQILGGAKRILKGEGFAVHGEKFGVHRHGRQQRVTGIVVNEKPSLDRRALRNFRALLNDALKNGPEAANRGRWPNFFGYIQGYTAYLQMVDAEKAKPFREVVDQIRQKYFAK